MPKIHVTSDPHFGHKKIVEYERPEFTSLAHMEYSLIENWNNVVKPEDTTYVLGDFCFYARDCLAYAEKLNGKKILVLGNHDRSKIAKNPNKFGFEAVHEFGVDLKEVSLSHYPMNEHRRKLGMHGHLHRVDSSEIVRNYHVESYRRHFVNANVCVENWGYFPLDMELLISVMKNKYDEEDERLVKIRADKDAVVEEVLTNLATKSGRVDSTRESDSAIASETGVYSGVKTLPPK